MARDRTSRVRSTPAAKVGLRFPSLSVPAPPPQATSVPETGDGGRGGVMDRVASRWGARERSALLSALLLLVGVMSCSFGMALWVGMAVGVVAGLGASMATFGILVFVVGVLFGLNT